MDKMVNTPFGDFFKNKKVFITGHTGFKGAWLCLLLHKLGADIYGYSLDPPTKPSLFKIANIDKIVTTKIGDIRDFDCLKTNLTAIRPEIIIHMAAQPIVRESYINPIETYQINVMGTVNLLEAVRQVPGIKAVVNVTTDKCYENKEWHWGYREYEPMGGYDPYSNSKGCSELVTAAYRNSFFNELNYLDHGIAIATARAGNVVGGGDWANDRLIPDVMKAILNKKPIKIRSPYAIRPWQHALEPLTGYLILAQKLFMDGPIYAQPWNFGPNNENVKTVQNIIELICQRWGNQSYYEMDNDILPHEAVLLRLDSSKANALLNWHPKWTIEKTIDAIVEWYKAYTCNENMTQVCYKQVDDYFKE